MILSKQDNFLNRLSSELNIRALRAQAHKILQRARSYPYFKPLLNIEADLYSLNFEKTLSGIGMIKALEGGLLLLIMVQIQEESEKLEN